MLAELIARSNNQCELCGDSAALQVHSLPSGDGVLVCGACMPQIKGEITDSNHWYCLQGSIWSDVPAVAALSWWMLTRMPSEGWAVETVDGIDLDDSVTSLMGAGEPEDESIPVVDSNGAALCDGDSVTLIKDLDVKGANFTAKRGTLVKNIRLGFDPTHVEGRINKQSIMLKTCFLKRA